MERENQKPLACVFVSENMCEKLRFATDREKKERSDFLLPSKLPREPPLQRKKVKLDDNLAGDIAFSLREELPHADFIWQIVVNRRVSHFRFLFGHFGQLSVLFSSVVKCNLDQQH